MLRQVLNGGIWTVDKNASDPTGWNTSVSSLSNVTLKVIYCRTIRVKHLVTDFLSLFPFLHFLVLEF
jgi:hypothetical protein